MWELMEVSLSLDEWRTLRLSSSYEPRTPSCFSEGMVRTVKGNCCALSFDFSDCKDVTW